MLAFLFSRLSSLPLGNHQPDDVDVARQRGEYRKTTTTTSRRKSGSRRVEGGGGGGERREVEGRVSERNGTRTKTKCERDRKRKREKSEKEESEQECQQTGLTRWPSGISPAKSVPRSGDSGSTHRRYFRAGGRTNE